MDKTTLSNFAKDVDCTYDLGLWSEINSFHKNELNVDSFNVSFNREINAYELNVRLKLWNIVEIKKLLHDLLIFVEFKDTMYIQEELKNEIKYCILSKNKSNKGFLLKITYA
ncbi:hypothetical protein [Paenibacillus sp. SI8]|uniref:hypothetical protein n=1 Tax=unclassified Paenibacillus TaxID=185978 RepID=UPI003466E66D